MARKHTGSPVFPENTKNIAKNLQKNIVKKGEGLFSGLPFRNLVLIALFIDIVIIGLIVSLKKLLPPEVPLMYGLPEGEEQLTTTNGLIVPAIASIVIIVANSSVSLILKNSFLKKTLILTTFVVTFFSTITIIKIFFLVGNL
jgi:magnesium-transporting ATPase (P-type)